MKQFAFILLVLLCGCASSSERGEPQRYGAWVGQVAFLDREMTLYEAKPHQFTFTPYVLSRGKLSGVSTDKDPIGRTVAVVPTGAEIRIVAFKRQRGGDGHVWDYLLGELRLSPEGATIPFEYLVGLADVQRALPFSATLREPNQLPEPSRASVTPAADAPVAPAAPAVH
jgi:hypothetical protein